MCTTSFICLFPIYFLLRKTHKYGPCHLIFSVVKSLSRQICATPALNSAELRAGLDYQAPRVWGPTPDRKIGFRFQGNICMNLPYMGYCGKHTSIAPLENPRSRCTDRFAGRCQSSLPHERLVLARSWLFVYRHRGPSNI